MDFLLMTVLVLLVAILLWALTGDRESAEIPQLPPSSPAEEDKIPPEKTFRRRAMDKEIEEETGPLRRREDHPSLSDHHEVEEDFELPYSVDEIIPASSRFRVFRRTLLNSEAYARRGDFTTAISLYDGVKHRIADRETKYRIDTNIEYLSQYRQHKKEEQEERRRQLTAKQQSRQPSEVRFSIDGQVPQVVNIGMNDTGPEKIAELVSEQIRRELDNLKQDKAGTERDENLSRLENQLDELRNSMDLLNLEKNRAIEELEHLKQDREHRDRDEIERLRNEIQSINNLKQELNDLNKRIVDSMLRVPEVSAPPVIPEARFTLDPGPILEILEKIPKQPKEESIPEKIEPESIAEELPLEELPEPEAELVTLEETDFIEITDKPEPHTDETTSGAVTYPEELRDSDLVQLEGITEEPAAEELPPEEIVPEIPSAAEIPREEEVQPEQIHPVQETAEKPSPAEEETRTIREEVTREEVKEDDFELVKELGKEEQRTQFDELSDEEIFERILKENRPQQQIEDSSFEILGDRRDELGDIDFIDREQEEKRREEEDFYRKFLKSDKMKKKELPILKVTYDFTKLPHEMSLSKEKNIIEYSFYKYRPMLEKAADFIQKRKVKDAINYYKVVLDQNIPPEFKVMLRRNINDLTEYLERYLTGD